MDFDMDVDLFGDNDGNDGNDAQDYSVYESADEKSRIKTSSPGKLRMHMRMLVMPLVIPLVMPLVMRQVY